MKTQPDPSEDDERVICDMNVPGMPWYSREQKYAQGPTQDRRYLGERISKSELRRYTWYAVLAGLTVVAVFAVVWILFTLFATQIWFQ